MSRKRTQHTKQFKLEAVNYRKEHPALPQAEVTKVTKRCVSPSRILKFLGMSRSGYRAFLNRKISPALRQKKPQKGNPESICALWG